MADPDNLIIQISLEKKMRRKKNAKHKKKKVSFIFNTTYTFVRLVRQARLSALLVRLGLARSQYPPDTIRSRTAIYGVLKHPRYKLYGVTFFGVTVFY